jgi:CRISPR-associated endonuclease Cas2
LSGLFAADTQFSLFECELDKKELEVMLASIHKIIDPKEDAIKVYRLCHECLHNVRVIGLGRVAVEPECVII